ncbi:amino acid permease [Pontiellaceae bacterium B1224]|nr:amino acid permease [Pontiellaceae bacterium B1224]
MKKEKPSAPSSTPTKFGTFGGVFTPSLLTILGVIMFLRYANVVGYAGLWGALVILLAAKIITVLTGLSLSSVSTNMRVKGGGAYFLISRSLGVEFGGVIAIFFYIAQAVAVTMYVIGFSEALFSAFPDLGLSMRAVGSITNLVVFICVYIGAGWTIRLQYGILAVLLLSIVSFAVGAWMNFSPELLQANLTTHWTPEFSFFTVFALFFPAVTGIMAGVNMSGDLKNPAKSIPVGTFASIAVSALIYAGVAVLLAASSSRSELLGDGFVMKDKAWLGALIYAGVISATLSSALGSMMGAPRILQAFARDNIFKKLKWFAHGSGASAEPRRAVILTFLISQVGILAGDLNTIAPIITMFFLLTYGTVNLACFYEGITQNPSFRPTFRFNHWSAALLGALGCLGIMFLINAVWACVAIVLAAGLYVLIKRAKIIVQWGDLDSGLAYQRARKALLKLEQERYHPKNWRPSILALSGGAWSRVHLAEYACWLSANLGMVSLGQVIEGDLDNYFERRRIAEERLRKFIQAEEFSAFPVVVVEDDINAAVKAMLQCHGVGGLRPNTLLLGWSEDPEKIPFFSEALLVARKMQRSIIIVSCEEERLDDHVPSGPIDVWWNNPKEGSLMLMLAYLLKRNHEWRDRPLRLLRPVGLQDDAESATKKMQLILSVARIEAEVVILPTADPLAAVREVADGSGLLFAGFDPAEEGPEGTLPASLCRTIDLPGDVIMVYSAGDVALQS